MIFLPTAGSACPRKKARALNSSWKGACVLAGVVDSQAPNAAIPAAVISYGARRGSASGGFGVERASPSRANRASSRYTFPMLTCTPVRARISFMSA